MNAMDLRRGINMVVEAVVTNFKRGTSSFCRSRKRCCGFYVYLLFLYGSVENLNKNGYASSSSSSTTRALYRCPNAEILDRSRNHVYYPISCNPETICPRHRIKLTQQLAYVKANGGKVKGGVKPESSFRKLHVRDLGSLEVKDVNMMDIEVLKIMEASLESDTILTDVFLQRPC